MSRYNYQTRSGVLEQWSKVFEKSKASKVPITLPYRETATRTDLELEDVFEEVKEEVDSKVSKRLTNTKYQQDNTPVAPEPLIRRKSRELVRPKTPGRLGLYQESTLLNKNPPWQSSTKVIKQQRAKYEYNKPHTVEGDSKSRFETSNSEASCQSSDRYPIGVKYAILPKPAKEESPVKLSDMPAIEPEIYLRPGTPARSSTQSISTTPTNTATPARSVTPIVIPVKHNVSGGEPISQRTAMELRQVLFGSALTSFNSDWRSQHINFLKHSSYGLSFYKPGPCGLMACIQAFLMKYLLFHKKRSDFDVSVLDPLPSERQQALVSGMARMIWQAGNNSHGVVVLPCGTCRWKITKEYREDDVTETLVIFRFNDLTEIEKFIKRNLSFFENTGGNGCISFLYSVILSRTIKGIYTDMGTYNSKLMGHNETCSQSILNLLLTGRAVSHVFNGDVEYDKRGNALPLPLKGIKARSDIGFLTLKEHLKPKEIQVGSMYKTPKSPIWIVESVGGRYGIIFCLNRELVNDWRLERRFNLNFYNGTTIYGSTLDEIITVDTRDIVDVCEITEDTHPLEHILRTKWPGAVVEWNRMMSYAMKPCT